VGVYEDGVLRYSGKVGTGFTQHELARPCAPLEPLSPTQSPFDPPPPSSPRSPVCSARPTAPRRDRPPASRAGFVPSSSPRSSSANGRRTASSGIRRTSGYGMTSNRPTSCARVEVMTEEMRLVLPADPRYIDVAIAAIETLADRAGIE